MTGALSLAALVGLPGLALATWPAEGIQVCQACIASLPVVVADGNGGAYVAWQDRRNGNADVYVQRVTATGEIATGWPPDGVPACIESSNQFLTIQHPAVSDGAGGIIVPWIDYRDFVPGGTLEDIYAQRILPDGSIAPGWIPNGVPANRSSTRVDSPVLIPDGAGGAFFSWYEHTGEDVHLQHLTAGGTVPQGWPADGLPVCTLPSVQGFPQIAPDGAGGVLIAWGDFRDGPFAVYAQHVTHEGEIAPGWSVNGERIVSERAIRGLVSDGTGGGYVSYATLSQIGDDDYYVQRFLTDGSIAPGWPQGGVPVCLAPDERNSLRMVPDGTGGVLIVWADYRDSYDDDIFALRIRPDGALYPGWPVDGLRVSDNTALDDLPDLAPDGVGGAYLTWDLYTTAAGDRVMVQHLTGSGTVAPGWAVGGAQIPSESSSGLMRVAEDGAGGAFVAWHTANAGDEKVRVLRYATDGPVAVAVSLVSAEAELALVRLVWFASNGGSLAATVERRIEAAEWEPLGTVTADGTGGLAFEDREVTPGARYAYRLAYTDGETVAHTAETWVTVPEHRFSLRGITPNPSAGEPMVSLSLVGDEPAVLEVFDLAGRRVFSRELHGEGPQTIRLEPGARLAAGVYTVRLRQGGEVAAARAAILR